MAPAISFAQRARKKSANIKALRSMASGWKPGSKQGETTLFALRKSAIFRHFFVRCHVQSSVRKSLVDRDDRAARFQKKRPAGVASLPVELVLPVTPENPPAGENDECEGSESGENPKKGSVSGRGNIDEPGETVGFDRNLSYSMSMGAFEAGVKTWNATLSIGRSPKFDRPDLLLRLTAGRRGIVTAVPCRSVHQSQGSRLVLR